VFQNNRIKERRHTFYCLHINHYHTNTSIVPSFGIKGPGFSKDNETDVEIRQHTGNGDKTI